MYILYVILTAFILLCIFFKFIGRRTIVFINGTRINNNNNNNNNNNMVCKKMEKGQEKRKKLARSKVWAKKKRVYIGNGRTETENNCKSQQSKTI